eukprot:609884-Pelagomonas_calceolata.AAC.4
MEEKEQHFVGRENTPYIPKGTLDGGPHPSGLKSFENHFARVRNIRLEYGASAKHDPIKQVNV